MTRAKTVNKSSFRGAKHSKQTESNKIANSNKESKSNIPSKSNASKHKVKTTQHKKHKDNIIEDPKQYKKELLEIDKSEEKFDKLFEQKLAKQYKEFRNMKEHHMQTKKFIRIFIILTTIVLITLLLLSFS